MATKRTTKKAETMAAKKAVAEEAVKEAVEAVKETVKETVAKEPEKAAAKKPAAPRKTAEKKAVVANTDVYVQFMGKELVAKEVVAAVKKSWMDANGKKEEDIKDVKVYIKPEEGKAYYVVNGESESSFIEL